MTRATAASVALLLAWAIATLWIPARWPLAILQCGALALAAIWAASAALHPNSVALHKQMLPLAGVILLAIVQLALHTTIYRHDTWEAALVWTTNLALFFLALQFSASRTLRLRFLQGAVWFGCALATVAMLQQETSPKKIFWIFPAVLPIPPAGPFLSRNQYAAFIELLLPIAVTAAIADRKRALPYTAAAALMYASVIAAASRAGAVILSAEFLLILALALHRRLLKPRRVVPMLALLAIFTAAAGWTVLQQRWQEPQGVTIRLRLLHSSLNMIRDRPAQGFGLGTWPTAYPAYASYDDGTYVNQAHNDWAQWTAEGGIPMLILLLSIAAANLTPSLSKLWPLGITAVFLHALVDYPLQKPALSAVFFTLLGIAAMSPKKDLDFVSEMYTIEPTPPE